jgi:hypothetical protein
MPPWVNDSPPGWFDARSVVLLLVMIFLAYLISPWSQMDKQERDRLALAYPPLIFVYVYLFQISLLSLGPYFHYYLGPSGVRIWKTDTDICCGFGIAFSIAIMIVQKYRGRIYGAFSLLSFCILFFGYKMPPEMNIRNMF